MSCRDRAVMLCIAGQRRSVPMVILSMDDSQIRFPVGYGNMAVNSGLSHSPFYLQGTTGDYRRHRRGGPPGPYNRERRVRPRSGDRLENSLSSRG
jgi:hypothetical protein